MEEDKRKPSKKKTRKNEEYYLNIDLRQCLVIIYKINSLNYYYFEIFVCIYVSMEINLVEIEKRHI
jgi:hypothetical protein